MFQDDDASSPQHPDHHNHHSSATISIRSVASAASVASTAAINTDTESSRMLDSINDNNTNSDGRDVFEGGGAMIMTSSESSPPRTELLIRNFIFYLLGIGLLVPWNAFVSAADYFSRRTCRNLASPFAFCYNLASVCTLGGMIVYQVLKSDGTVDEAASTLLLSQDDPNSGQDDGELQDTSVAAVSRAIAIAPEGEEDSVIFVATTTRVTGDSLATTTPAKRNSNGNNLMVTLPLTVYLIAFIVQASMVWMTHDIMPSPLFFLTTTIFSLSACGMACGVAQAGIVARAGTYSNNTDNNNVVMNSYLTGQSVGGVAVSLANFLAAFMEDPNDFWELRCSNNNSSSSASPFSQQESIISDSRRQLLLDDDDDAFTFEDVWATTAFAETVAAETATTAVNTCAPYAKIDVAVFLYFFAGCLVVIACIVGYNYLDRIPPPSSSAVTIPTRNSNADYYQQVDQQHQNQHRDDDEAAVLCGAKQHPQEQQPLQNSECTGCSNSNDTSGNGAAATAVDRLRLGGGGGGEADGLMRSSLEITTATARLSSSPEDDSNEDTTTSTTSTLSVVWKQVQGPATCIFLVFFVTLSLFPGWTSQLRSIHQCNNHNKRLRTFNDLYTPMTFLVFSFGDLVGRILSSHTAVVRWMEHSKQHFSKYLVVAACLRVAFAPALFLCFAESSSQDDQHQRHPPFTIHSDTYSWMMQFAFAISNGFLLSLSFCHAPSCLNNKNSSALSRMSEILNFAVVMGLLCGSMLSFLV